MKCEGVGTMLRRSPRTLNNKWPKAFMVNGVKQKFGRGVFWYATSEGIGSRTTDTILRNVQGKMRKFGESSKTVISITYKTGRMGRVFNGENVHGTICYVDA